MLPLPARPRQQCDKQQDNGEPDADGDPFAHRPQAVERTNSQEHDKRAQTREQQQRGPPRHELQAQRAGEAEEGEGREAIHRDPPADWAHASLAPGTPGEGRRGLIKMWPNHMQFRMWPYSECVASFPPPVLRGKRAELAAARARAAWGSSFRGPGGENPHPNPPPEYRRRVRSF